VPRARVNPAAFAGSPFGHPVGVLQRAQHAVPLRICAEAFSRIGSTLLRKAQSKVEHTAYWDEEKVSQAARLPEVKPCLNQKSRWAEVPWVNLSGMTRPVCIFCR
jgi:hypothetical protein